jgi:hypothetical protein
VIAGSGDEKILVTKPKPGSTGRSLIAVGASRHAEMD